MESVFEETYMPAENINNFDFGLIAARITNTDELVRTIQEKVQENENLKRQMQSFNESAQSINQAYQTEKQKSTLLESNESMLKDRVTHLETELSITQNKFINEKALKEQIVAKLEETVADQSKLIGMCQQFLIQSEILSEHRLNNNSLLAWHRKALDVLKANGVAVKRFKRFRKEVSTADQAEVQCSTSTMTDKEVGPTVPAVVLCSTSTMTEDEVKPVPVILPQRTFCDKSTMHFQTTATRGTNTKWSLPETISVGTNYPEPISIQEIFRRTICELPEMVTAIEEFKWPKNHSATQTSGSSTDEPVKRFVDAATITHIKNVRKHINYNRIIKEKLLQPNSANPLFPIKKEELSSNGSMPNLAFPMTDSIPRVPPINPQLTGLWQFFGEYMFSLIGSGRIFDGEPSVMEHIYANLNVIRSAVESRNFATEAEVISRSREMDATSTGSNMMSTDTNAGKYIRICSKSQKFNQIHNLIATSILNSNSIQFIYENNIIELFFAVFLCVKNYK